MSNYTALYYGSKPVIRMATGLSAGWVRNSKWLTLPTIDSTGKQFAGLLGITNDEGNYNAILAQGSSGYLVDWGDGTAVSGYASNTKAEYWYDYNSIPLSTEFTGIAGDKIRQVIVNLYPSGGGTLTDINLQQIHSKNLLQAYSPSWLDISLNGPDITSLEIGGTSYRLSWLEKINIGTIGSITNFINMFYNCNSLQSISQFDTSAGVAFNAMFQFCSSLQSVPLLNTSAGTNFTSMFYGCSSLQSIPQLNTIAGTVFTNMFTSCPSLQSIPQLNTSAGTNFTSMFNSCPSLQFVPQLNTANGTNFSSMFLNCNSLQYLPQLDVSKGTNFSQMFQGCSSLRSVPQLNTVAGTNFSNMFYSCGSIKSAPQLDTTKGTNFVTMFYSCPSLQSIPRLNTAKGTNFGLIFGNDTSLCSGTLSGTRYSISYSSGKLSRNAIVDIFNNLGTGISSPTITVSNNYGYPELTAADSGIATGKLWTIN